MTFDKKIELKLTGTSTVVGVLYADCDTYSAEVRYKGRLDGDDTDIVIAYNEDETTGNETLLMFSDYNAGAGYPAAKIAVHYTESGASQSVTYGYAEDSTTGSSGTFTANSSGTLTDAVDADVTSDAVVTDLRALIGSGTVSYTLTLINAATFSL